MSVSITRNSTGAGMGRSNAGAADRFVTIYSQYDYAVVVDTVTGVNYLRYNIGSNMSGNGGALTVHHEEARMMPLLNSDGKPLCSSQEELQKLRAGK